MKMKLTDDSTTNVTPLFIACRFPCIPSTLSSTPHLYDAHQDRDVRITVVGVLMVRIGRRPGLLCLGLVRAGQPVRYLQAQVLALHPVRDLHQFFGRCSWRLGGWLLSRLVRALPD